MRTGAGAICPGFYLPVYAPFPGWFAGIRGATHTSPGTRPESPLKPRKRTTENPPRSYRKPPEKCKCILRRFLSDLGRVYYFTKHETQRTAIGSHGTIVTDIQKLNVTILKHPELQPLTHIINFCRYNPIWHVEFKIR